MSFETKLADDCDAIYSRLENLGVNVRSLKYAELSIEQISEQHGYLLRLVKEYRSLELP